MNHQEKQAAVAELLYRYLTAEHNALKALKELRGIGHKMQQVAEQLVKETERDNPRYLLQFLRADSCTLQFPSSKMQGQGVKRSEISPDRIANLLNELESSLDDGEAAKQKINRLGSGHLLENR